MIKSILYVISLKSEHDDRVEDGFSTFCVVIPTFIIIILIIICIYFLKLLCSFYLLF